jgi:ribonuclease P protein component
MLKKNHKLDRSDFTTVFETRKVYSSSHFTFRFAPVRSWDEFGVSVVVSKKVEKLAVHRNRVKRRAYYALKVISENLEKPFKGIFVMKKSVREMDFYDLELELQNLIKNSVK